MHVALVQQLAPDRLARAALEQHVVGHDHRGAAVDRQDRLDVLDEVELLVAGRGPEVVADDHLRLALGVAFFVDEGDAGLLAEGRVGQHHVEAVARIGGEAVGHADRAGAAVGADAVEVEIHHAEPRRDIHDLPAVQRPVPQVIPLLTIQRVVFLEIIVRGQQEAAGADCRIADCLPRRGCITSTMALISARGVKYCPAPDLMSWAFFSGRPS